LSLNDLQLQYASNIYHAIYKARVRQNGRRTRTGYFVGTDTIGVPLHAYPRHTRFCPKKIPRYGLGRVRYGLGTGGTKTKSNDVVSTRFLLLSYSILSPLSQAEPLDSLSHFLTLPVTGDERCSDCGLAATEGALILISLLNMKDEAEERNRRGKR
jgi:hypothetical protein